MADDDYAGYPIEAIVDHFQNGSGYLRSKTQRHETLRLMQRLENLGWDPIYLQSQFKYMNDYIIADWEHNLFIEKYFKALVNQQSSTNSIKTLLSSMGLRPQIVLLLENIVTPLEDYSYTSIQCVELVIDYLLGRYNPIAPIDARHLIHPTSTNAWFQYKYSNKSKQVNVYNLTQPCTLDALGNFKGALRSLPSMHGEYTYCYHITSWGGSLSILKKINRFKGYFCQDFGIFPGFYLSFSTKDCIDWGERKSNLFHNEVAVLIFAIPNRLPSQLRYKELKGLEWFNVTQESRECVQKDDEVELLDDYDLLYGDMVSNPTKVRSGMEPPISHRPPKKQLVSKSDAADKFLHSCIIGCVYFQKS
jgi:hypothetical protein